MVKEIIPGIFSWSEYSEEKGLDFNGYLVIAKGECVIIDPPELGNDEEELKNIIDKHSSCPLKGIILTNVHHERASNSLKNRFSVPIWVNEKDKEGLEVSAGNTFRVGDILFCGILAIQLEDQKSPGETAFYIKVGLKKLMSYEFETLLVGDGVSILKNAKEAVATFLAS